MLIKTLTQLFADNGNMQQTSGKGMVAPQQNKNATEEKKARYINPEIQCLADVFGGQLCKGHKEIELHHLLQIVPRKRHRADAYKGLVSELRKNYGVELHIVSAHKKKEKQNE